MTEQSSKFVSLFRKVESLAMAAVGAGIFVMGGSYFREKTLYHVPRILMPVYKLLGNVGLAVGMLILGLLLTYWAYTRFKQHNGKSIYFASATTLTIIVFAVVIWMPKSDNGKSLRDKEQAKIENAERPKLSDKKANVYLDKLEQSLADMQKAHAEGDKTAFKQYEQEFIDNQDELFGELINTLGQTDDYEKFILYNVKICNQIHELRGIMSKNEAN